MSRLMLLALFSAVLVFGCGQASQMDFRHQVQVAQKPPAGKPAAAPVDDRNPAVPSRMIIYVCQLDLTVESFDKSAAKLNELIESIQSQGGYLANHDVSGPTGSTRRGSWTIRVPLPELDRFLSAVAQLGEINRNTRDGKDITDSYADLESRLRNKEASEKRLLQHLDHSAQLSDTLELERELTRVRGEIEQMQGNLNLLKNKADLATVTVTMQQRPDIAPPVVATGFPALITRTFHSSINGLVSCGQIFVLLIVALAPWAVTAGVLSIPWWIVRRQFKTAVHTEV